MREQPLPQPLPAGGRGDREGRGRLSSLDLVPEDGRDAVFWALGELNKRERTQEDILFELNDRLQAAGCEKISRSAFNRKAVRMAAAARRLSEARHIFAGLADQFTPDKIDEGNIGLGEVIKTLIFELTDPDNGHGPKEAMELARAYQATISGQKLSAERRLKMVADIKSKIAKAVDAVEGEIGKEGGTPDGAAVLKKIREDIYGIFDR